MKVQAQFNGVGESRQVGPIRDARYGYRRILTEAAQSLGWVPWDGTGQPGDQVGYVISDVDNGIEYGFATDLMVTDLSSGNVIEVIRVNQS